MIGNLTPRDVIYRHPLDRHERIQNLENGVRLKFKKKNSVSDVLVLSAFLKQFVLNKGIKTTLTRPSSLSIRHRQVWRSVFARKELLRGFQLLLYTKILIKCVLDKNIA